VSPQPRPPRPALGRLASACHPSGAAQLVLRWFHPDNSTCVTAYRIVASDAASGKLLATSVAYTESPLEVESFLAYPNPPPVAAGAALSFKITPFNGNLSGPAAATPAFRLMPFGRPPAAWDSFVTARPPAGGEPGHAGAGAAGVPVVPCIGGKPGAPPAYVEFHSAWGVRDRGPVDGRTWCCGRGVPCSASSGAGLAAPTAPAAATTRQHHPRERALGLIACRLLRAPLPLWRDPPVPRRFLPPPQAVAGLSADRNISVSLFHPDPTLTACVTGYTLDFLGPSTTALQSVDVPAASPVSAMTTAQLPPAAARLVRAAAAPGGAPLLLRVTARDGALAGAPRLLAPYSAVARPDGGVDVCRDGTPGQPRGGQPLISGRAEPGSKLWRDVRGGGRAWMCVARTAPQQTCQPRRSTHAHTHYANTPSERSPFPAAASLPLRCCSSWMSSTQTATCPTRA
jgi:hypothetical protein